MIELQNRWPSYPALVKWPGTGERISAKDDEGLEEVSCQKYDHGQKSKTEQKQGNDYGDKYAYTDLQRRLLTGRLLIEECFGLF